MNQENNSQCVFTAFAVSTAKRCCNCCKFGHAPCCYTTSAILWLNCYSNVSGSRI